MKIILLKLVKGLGQPGDTKEVKKGYARNHLIPAGLAKQASRHDLFFLESQKRKTEKQKIIIAGDTLNTVDSLAGKIFDISAKIDDKGNLYAKISVKKIAKVLNEQGYNIDFKSIKIKETIKKLENIK